MKLSSETAGSESSSSEGGLLQNDLGEIPQTAKKNWVKDTVFWKVVIVVALAMSCFHFYTALNGILRAWLQRCVHIMFVLMLGYLSYGKFKGKAAYVEKIVSVSLVVFVAWYSLKNNATIMFRDGNPTTMDMIVGAILVLLLIEAARRFVGPAMATVIIVFILYTFFGHYLPGRLNCPKYTFGRIIGQLYNSTAGIMGSTAGTSATNVVMFIFLGAFLQESGAGEFFSDTAIKATRKIRGGPAKAAVVASALMGMIQGNSISNVATTGTFTIPLMKKSGYSATFAGAVEATASTGGMIMPPVMGAAAFLMAEFTSTSYNKIIVYAIVPALLYYLGVYLVIHFRALKINLIPVDMNGVLSRKEMFWKGLTAMVPLCILITMMLLGRSPQNCATVSIISLVIIWLIRPVERMKIKSLLSAMISGSMGMITVGTACASAGIVVGTISLTGLGIKISVLTKMAQSNVWVLLILCMVVCIVLGMGLPVTASYVLSAVTLGSALTSIGFGLIPAHLFLMYFCTMSAITPPVALASYTAAGISGASPNATGWQALLIAIPAFIVPFCFIFNTELLLMGQTVPIILAILSAALGVFSVSLTTEGWMFCRLGIFQRILTGTAAILLLAVGSVTDIIGVILLGIAVGWNFIQSRRKVTG